MLARLAASVLLIAGLRGCLTYEYEHEFWLRVDGSGTVNVTGRPALFLAFKGLGRAGDGEATAEAVRRSFEGAGLRVRRVTVNHRDGHAYVFIAADFDDVNKLALSPAFPDLRIALVRAGDQLRLEGEWARPEAGAKAAEADGLMAVRFHLPSKVYSHQNAVEGVERGNIVSWRQEVAEGLGGKRLTFGVVMDSRSILRATLALFALALVLAAILLGGGLYLVARQGKKTLAAPAASPPA